MMASNLIAMASKPNILQLFCFGSQLLFWFYIKDLLKADVQSQPTWLAEGDELYIYIAIQGYKTVDSFVKLSSVSTCRVKLSAKATDKEAP